MCVHTPEEQTPGTDCGLQLAGSRPDCVGGLVAYFIKIPRFVAVGSVCSSASDLTDLLHGLRHPKFKENHIAHPHQDHKLKKRLYQAQE